MPDLIFKTWDPYYGNIDPPIPATKCVPDYYKKMPIDCTPPKVENNNRLSVGKSVKACIPIRDLLTAGYILPLWEELFIEKSVHNESVDGRVFAFANAGEGRGQDPLAVIEGHGMIQVVNSPLAKKARDKETGGRIPKLSTPWSFYTPPGYSCLFLPPQYRENRIEILPAIVDTDKWHLAQFPFLYNGFMDKETVPIGEPIVQVIPFKRENWKVKVEKNEKPRQNLLYPLFKRLSHAYQNMYHVKKHWR